MTQSFLRELTTPAIERRLIEELVTVASQAAAAILAIDRAAMQRAEKQDHSPVTAADEASQAVILNGLGRVFPGVPIVSEESTESHGVALGSRFFLVDPLDGTREYIANEAEYGVNIALIDGGIPVAGVIAAPALGTVWAGGIHHGAERLLLQPGADAGAARERVAIRTRSRPAAGAVALISRFHRDAKTDAYLDRVPDVQRMVCGASIKFCRIAEGTADLYVRMASISEWDAAAGHGLVIAAGGSVTAFDGTPLPYGRPGLRLPPFIVSGDRSAKNPD